MVSKPDLTANHRVILDHHAATDPRLRRDHDALANVAVVTHVNHVVELRATTDARATQRSAVNARVRADLDVIFNHYGTNLRKLLITEIVTHVTKTISAQTNAGMQYHAMSDCDSIVQNNVRVQ